MALPGKEIRISSSAQITGYNTARYRFLKVEPGQNPGAEFIMYRRAKLKGEWPNKYVEYYFRHPETAAWKRFKVYEDLNRNKSVDYDLLLLNAVNDKLQAGFNPFNTTDPFEPNAKEETKPYTIQRALHYFLLKWKDRGVEADTIARYTRAIKYFEDWLLMKGLQHTPAALFVNKSEIIQIFICKRSCNYTGCSLFAS